VANLLNPSETLTVTVTQEIPSVSVPGTSAKIFIAQSMIQPLDPVITAVSPAHGAVGIGTSSPITLTFSKSMNTATVQSAFATVPSTTGSFAWSTTNSPNDTMTCTPGGSGLAANTAYTVRLANTAADAVSGNSIFAPFESRFTTGSNAVQATPPTASTTAATNLAQTAATLNGSVNPNGAATTVYFQYGTRSSYGSTTSSQNIGNGVVVSTASSNVTGLRSGRTYHFRVVAVNSAGTTYGADQTFVTPTTAQLTTATTNAATNVTINSATLNGTVNPGGTATTVQFQFGVAPNVLTSSTALQSIGSGTSNVSVSADISGLAANTTYYFTVVATNGTDPNITTTTGSILTFTTPPLTPSATTTAASGLGTSAATLNATVNPNGSATTAYFDYGLTSSYGSSTDLQNIGSATTAGAVSAAMTGLDYGTTYHYRVTGTNSFGSTQGLDQTFSTAYSPPSVTTDVAAPLGMTTATLNGTANASGTSATAWFEYGLTSSYGNSTRQSAGDNAESYSSWNFTTSSNGGTGFGPAISLGGTGGGLYLANSSTGGRQIDGNNSFGVYAGSGGQALCRSITNPNQVGTLTLSARFDVSNALAFTGFNIKSAQGTSFAANELLSFGLNPSTGNNALLVKGSVNQTINLGSEIRGQIIDFKLDYDSVFGTYILGAKFRSSPTYVTVSGNLEALGQTTTHLGFASFNNNGSNQNLIFDGLALATSASAGNGRSPAPISTALSGLAANTVYHYRAIAMNGSGTTFGPDLTLKTLTALEQWRQANFGTTNPADPAGGDNADPDSDGVANILEYAFGMNPTSPDVSLLPSIGRFQLNGASYLTITFRKLHATGTGVTYTVQESSNLLGWNAVDSIANLVAGPTDQLDGTDLLTVRSNIPMSNAKGFMHILVTAP
jgi:hypothetical protein